MLRPPQRITRPTALTLAATAAFAAAPVSAQVTAKDLRAQAREITLLRTEVRQQQDLVLLLRHRLAEAESAGAWLPWLLAAVAVGWGLAGWMALKWRKSGVKGHSLPAKGEAGHTADDDSLTGPATVFAPGAMGLVQESSTAVHQISTAQLPLDINQLVPPAPEETRPAAVTLSPGTHAEQAFLSAVARRSAAEAEAAAKPPMQSELAARPAPIDAAAEPSRSVKPPLGAPVGPAAVAAAPAASPVPNKGSEAVTPDVRPIPAAADTAPRPSLASAPLKPRRPLDAALASADADGRNDGHSGLHTEASARIAAIEPQANAPRPQAGPGRPATAGEAEAFASRPFRGMADLQARPPAADATQVLPTHRAVSVDELFDLEQQVDFFVALDQTESAIDLLVSHIRSTGGNTALPYLKLMEVYRQMADVASYERTRRRFNQRFNAAAPEYADAVPAGGGLERYAAVLDRLQAVWAQPLDALALLEALMYRRARGELFDLSGFHDILMLHAVAVDLHEQSAWRGARTDILLPLEGAPAAASTASALAGAMLNPEPTAPPTLSVPAAALPASLAPLPHAAVPLAAATPLTGLPRKPEVPAPTALPPVASRPSVLAANDGPEPPPLAVPSDGAMGASAMDGADAFRSSLRNELAGITNRTAGPVMSPLSGLAAAAGAADPLAASPWRGDAADAAPVALPVTVQVEPGAVPPRTADQTGASSKPPASMADALSLDLDLSDFTPLHPAAAADRSRGADPDGDSGEGKPWDGLQRSVRAQG